ncbi:Vacuolar protein sorting-associated protein 8 [Xylographa trunciseda]|nr:Vacuolar protein sorting-associated protein 8 [Xylographa trunciseda]
MSTDQDETDIGPDDSDAETKNAQDLKSDNDKTTGGLRNVEPPPPSIVEILEDVRQEEQRDGDQTSNGKFSRAYGNVLDEKEDESSSIVNGDVLGSLDKERPSSADGSLSNPDDTPSVQNSILSSPGRYPHSSGRGHSPSSSLRPFDRRFQARTSQSPLSSPRPTSPAFLTAHSRHSSALSQLVHDSGDVDTPDAPWEVVRWTKLRKMSGQAFSEIGKRKFGRPTCIAVSASIALGTSKGMILIFDYHQTLHTIIGPGTQAVESGSVTSITFSADYSSVAGGHANGAIFTWDTARSAKPSLHIPSIDPSRVNASDHDGHVSGAAVLHIGFLGTRHTALVSADDKGMAFSHFASTGMGAFARSIRTTRILGRYPESGLVVTKPKKPSSVLAFAPLPLGNALLATDEMGLVAMLTPYLLVIVSTIPVAQTQHKASRPKELAAHGTMSAALAWFPAMKTNADDTAIDAPSSLAKLAYSWSNILTVLDVHEADVSEGRAKDKSPELRFIPRKRWKADEAIVAIQWLSRTVLSVITVSQQLIILEDSALRVTDSSDMIKKHIYHADLFSQQLSQLVEKLDEEDISMHGVVADAFYMSFKAYKGRLFLLGFSDVSMGTMSNWADRLLALMEEGNFIGAIELATAYYNGEGDKATVGLPEDDTSRHSVVQEKLIEMMSASLKYAFGRNQKAGTSKLGDRQLEALVTACFNACLSIEDMDFLFDDVYTWYSDDQVQGLFLHCLEGYITSGSIRILPPSVLKDLIVHFVEGGRDSELEETLCLLDPETMDIDQITNLCKQHKLYDALFYVWNQALGDYTTIMKDLLYLKEDESIDSGSNTTPFSTQPPNPISKVFPYLSYILTGRIYPTGESMDEAKAVVAKAEVYDFLFSSGRRDAVIENSYNKMTPSLPYLRHILKLDSSSFLSMLNEAFEDGFLNGSNDMLGGQQRTTELSEEQRFGLSVNRQFIISMLLEIIVPPEFGEEDIIYLDMFIARNIAKFSQFILLPGSTLQRVMVELCTYASEETAEDCQLSVEYLLSVFQPPDLLSMIPILASAHFYRILKLIYSSEKKYALLLETCFEDRENPQAIFDCITDCLKPTSELSPKQREDIRDVIVEHASDLVEAGLTHAAAIINAFAPELHDSLLETLRNDDHAQFQYLKEVLEPEESRTSVNMTPRASLNQNFIEQYVRLLCDYNPHHVSDYIGNLQTGDLRLEFVLPALESSGIIDAAVVIMAREGKIRDAIDRLTHYLRTLEAALIGLLDGAHESPDAANAQETLDDLVKSLQKYIRIGVWLCQSQTKAVAKMEGKAKAENHQTLVTDQLSLGEELWLDLVDTVVQVTRDVGDALESRLDTNTNGELRAPIQSTREPINISKVLSSLRAMVQETFTALLTATTMPPADDARRKDISFLRIFRAFLDRVSLSSPSIANLRSVLSAIFSAYSYEESLLDLANRLLDKDLFVHVAEVSSMRRRGWRPLGQVCEGCGKRVWGPGVGGGIWDAWVEAGQSGGSVDSTVDAARSRAGLSGKGKGKDAVSMEENIAEEDKTAEPAAEGRKGGNPGALVVFACRHVFHRRCLESMEVRENEPEAGERESLEFSCPLCK